MSYILNILVSIDQLGNVIAGGDPDNTISARVGFYNHHYPKEKKATLYWKILEAIIDFTFHPVDGPNHCHEAYHSDAGEFFDTSIKDWAILLLTVFIVLSCIPISITLYTLWLFKVISPKKNNRIENIDKRLVRTHSKLNGTDLEIEEHPIPINGELIQKAMINVELAESILKKLENPIKIEEGKNRKCFIKI